MPVLGVGVFWLWPWPIAAPLYGAILVVSVLVYRAMLTAMHRPAVSGREGLLHEVGEVVDGAGSEASVRVHGELWHAVSPDVLKPHDRVEVLDVEGLVLRVRKTGLRGR